MNTKSSLILVGLVLFTLSPSPLLAKTPDGRPPAVETDCDGLKGAAFGLCNAYCDAQDCDVHQRPSCDVLRRNFERLTGRSAFPCDVAATPTSTSTYTPNSTLTSTPSPTPTGTPTATPTLTPTEPPVVVSLPDGLVIGLVGGTVQANLAINNATGVQAFDVTVEFDPNVVQISQVVPSSFIGDCFHAINFSTPGELRVASLCPVPRIGGGVLFHVDFMAVTNSGSSPLHIAACELVDPNAELIQCLSDDGSIQVGPIASMSPTSTPTTTPP